MTTAHHIARLLLSAPQECGYLPLRTAQNVFIDPNYPLTAHHYELLMGQGFRRSGEHVYRPHCRCCQLCIPTRINAEQFVPNRSQKRNLKHNRDLHYTLQPATYTEEHYQLYRRYLLCRHRQSSMAQSSREDFKSFLSCRWMETKILTIYAQEQLLCVTALDVVPGGFSAIYTFYDPAQHKRGLGTFALQCALTQLRQQNLAHLYLGYWVDGSTKMCYKQNFSALEYAYDGKWHAHPPSAQAAAKPL